MDNKSRVKVLDTLRVLAILMVFIHHYYSAGIYPEIGELSYFGMLGVPLFFIISGFVINLTLERTDSYFTYLKNRFVRLSPAMLICSTIIFLFFFFFYEGEGYEHSKKISNFLIANSFIDPHVFNIIPGKINHYYLDNAFWSLWVEVCFYVLIGFLYYINKKKYLLYFSIICLVLMPLQILFYSDRLHVSLLNFFSEELLYRLKIIARGLALFNECIWFIIGMLLLKLYNTKNNKYLYFIGGLLFLCVLKERNLELVIFSSLVLIFIILFIYKPENLKFLEKPLLLKIGTASYCMYLIHYHLGVVFVKYLNDKYNLGYLSPIIAISAVILFGLFCYEFLEKRLIKLYKKILN